MKQTLSGTSLQVTVAERGAELVSLVDASGTEYMWRADPSVWGRSAPILFPVVGMLKDDRFRLEGTWYDLEKHGFVRDMDFSLVEQTENVLNYRLEPTVDTRKAFPFDFLLEVKFTLDGGSLEVRYRVVNRGDREMPFSIGAHPAFSLEWGAGDRIEDYCLEFEQPETVDTTHLNDDKLLSKETERVLTNENVLPLKRDMFDRDALILLDLKSERVTLASKKHSNRLTVEFPGFPYLGVWAKPAAPYVCIEPWHGHVDPEDTDGEILKKPGIITLAPGAEFICSHTIIVNR